MIGQFTYEIMESRKCTPCIKHASKCVEYESILEAKASCNEDENCAIIFEVNEQNRYGLCGVSSEKISHPRYFGSILFLKKASKIIGAYSCSVSCYILTSL